MIKKLIILVIFSCILFIGGCRNDNRINDAVEEEQNVMQDGNVSETSIVEKATQCYLDTFIKPNRKDATISDVWLYKNLGIYNNNLVCIFLDRNNCIFPDIVVKMVIDDYDFSYSYGYNIMVFSGESFYYLPIAYNNGFLSYDDMGEIYRKYRNQ